MNVDCVYQSCCSEYEPDHSLILQDMAKGCVTAAILVVLAGVASAATITDLVPGFTATPGFTVSTNISNLDASGEFVQVISN
jgi:hypothetical protein